MTPTVFFEMSLTNADKPPMNPKEVQRRMQRFISYVHDDTVDRDVNEAAVSSTSIMPNDWGILLTSHPLFVDKVKALRHCLSTTSTSPNTSTNTNTSIPTTTTAKPTDMTFVIGVDTMVRIIDPKYYNNDANVMLNAVRSMGHGGTVDFIVGGRVHQSKGNSSTSTSTCSSSSNSSTFITGQEEIQNLPKDIRDMFHILDENDFRVDLSSTVIRAKEEVVANNNNNNNNNK